MVAPIDYTLNVKSPFEAAIQGYGIGANMAEMQAKRQAAEVATQQAQANLERQQAAQAATQALFSNPNPTARDFIQVASMLPEKEAASMRANWDALSKDRQENSLKFSGQVLAAFNSGSPEVGTQLLMEKATAERNSGNENEAKAYETWAEIAKTNPQAAMKSLGVMVAQVPGGDKVIESVTKIGAESRAEAKAPSELSEAQSRAQKAAVDAKFAESNAVLEQQKKGWDITKLQEDIKIAKENSRIAAMNAAISREGNQLKRQEMGMKLEEMKMKRDEAVAGKVADVEAARSNMDNMLNTADRILKTPMGVIGSAAGPISSRIPTTSQSTADFEELVATLGSQSFISQIPNIKGMGALSNAEGEKLQQALQNFSLRQSPERLIENVKEAQRLILKGRSTLSKRYGIPDTVPDTPQAAPGAGDIDALVKKYGG